jgi:hypothetical protein
LRGFSHAARMILTGAVLMTTIIPIQSRARRGFSISAGV